MDSIEIIRQLQSDPALKAELRAVLLGEEVLGLPELVKENSRQIAENSRQIAENSRLIAENSREIASLIEAIKSHDKRLQRLENQVGEIDGSQLEEDIRIHPRQYLRRIHVTALRSLTDDERDEILSQLGEDELLDLDRIDAMLIGNRQEDDMQIYVAVEASATAEDHDLERALRRARLLSKATNSPTLPLVVTRNTPSDATHDNARRRGVALSTKQKGLVLEAPWISEL